MKLILPALALLLLFGCAPVFSDRMSSLVDQSLTFGQLKKDPNSLVGKYVKVGGIIASTKNTRTGSQLEIVQFKLGSDDMPDESQPSGGRFLAVTDDYLDSMVFRTGRPVSLIGEVTGTKTLPLDETEYTYPVIRIGEIHVWRTSDMYQPSPRYYYDPFFYPYWWHGDPFWRHRHHFRHW